MSDDYVSDCDEAEAALWLQLAAADEDTTDMRAVAVAVPPGRPQAMSEGPPPAEVPRPSWLRRGATPDRETTRVWAVAGTAPAGQPQATPQGPWPAQGPASPPMAHDVTPTAPTVEEDPVGLPPPARPVPPGTTTLLVRNIPPRFDQERLLQQWPADGTFDLLYLPYHPTSKKWPRGYAFINFVTPKLAVAFQQRWHGHYLSRDKRLVIVPAPLQGVDDNLEVLLRKDFMKLGKQGNLPALFEGTRRADTVAILRTMRSERKHT